MGCVPSRELHESPESLRFFHSGSLQLARIPLTPHFFPSSDCLAFRQLHSCRNTQSAKYGFAFLRPSCWYKTRGVDVGVSSEEQCSKGDTADDMAVRDSYEANAWDALCEEEREPNPSAVPQDEGYCMFQEDGERCNHMLGSSHDECPGDSDSSGYYFFREPEDLYDILVTRGTVPAMTDTNAEMRTLHKEECAWLSARKLIRQHRLFQIKGVVGKDRCTDCNDDARSAAADVEVDSLRGAEQTHPPSRFMWPLPSAVVAVLTPNKVTPTVVTPFDDEVPSDGALHLMEAGELLFLVSRLCDGTYTVPPTPVRVVGCDLLFPTKCRGTPWLRGTDDDPVEDEDFESLPPSQRPPVLCACHFCESGVCEKALSRARLFAFGEYARLLRVAKMNEIIARPVWHLGIASNVPLLQMCAEFRRYVRKTSCPNGAVVSVRGNRLLLRVQESAFRAVCDLCANAGCDTQQIPCQPIQERVFHSVVYDYGGRVGVHMRSGKLCVPPRTLALLQNNQPDAGLQEVRDAGCSQTLQVFVVTVPWKTAKGPLGSVNHATPPTRSITAYSDTFRDGDLLVYDSAHLRWTRVMDSTVMLEDALLYWVSKVISEATLRRKDGEWLRDRDHRIVRDGRFHIWSIFHDGLPYFFGVVPKFAKELCKRRLLQERKKNTKRGKTERRQKPYATTILLEQRNEEPTRTLPVTSRRHGDAANYFCNGCFTWNPYGRRR